MDLKMTHHQIHNIGSLTLKKGIVLPEVEIAYSCYGKLDPDGSNVILVTHGYTASHQILAKGEGIAEGAWSELYGEGKPLDPARYFIVCPNMLGSSYGSTGPGSINPKTQQAYGVDFPNITFSDIVLSQKKLLEELGVKHLRAVVGPSMGGFQALQWAVDYPDWVDAIGVIVSAPYLPHSHSMTMSWLMERLSAHSTGGGSYSVNMEGMPEILKALRIETLRIYGTPNVLAKKGLSPNEIEAKLNNMANIWSEQFNPMSLVILLQAALDFDVRAELENIKADVLMVIENTDELFPPNNAVYDVMHKIQGKFSYIEMNTGLGHTSSGPACSIWSESLSYLLNK